MPVAAILAARSPPRENAAVNALARARASALDTNRPWSIPVAKYS